MVAESPKSATRIDGKAFAARLRERVGERALEFAEAAGRKPGLAVVEFLPAIAPGLDRDSFMARLETEVETASDRLMTEAGFHADR